MGDIVATANTIAWVDTFQSLFGANTPEWQRTLQTWAALFHAEGRGNSELNACLMSITRHNPMPQFPTQFLAAIRHELKRQDDSVREANERTRLAETASGPPKCPGCRDSGWLIVPHVEFVEGPEWKKPRRTMAVTCCCPVGCVIKDRWASAKPDPKAVMSWDEYSGRNPHWKAQMEVRNLEVQAELAAHIQENGDFEWRNVVESILRRYGNV
jgi:hypothetical protein